MSHLTRFPTRPDAPTAVLFMIVVLIGSACGSSGVNHTEPRTSTPTATIAQTAAVDPGARAAVISRAHDLCARTIANVHALVQPAATPAALASDASALGHLAQSIGSSVRALPFPEADASVRADLDANIRESETDLLRARQRAAASDLAGGTASLADATDHLGEMSSVLQRYGVACEGPAQPSRAGLIAPSAEIAVGGYVDQVTAEAGDVWISRQDGRSVVRVDATTGRIVATVPVDDDDLRTIQVTSDGVWVRGATALHRIDPATNRVVQVVSKRVIGAAVARAFVDDSSIWACDGTNVVRASKTDGHPVATIALPYTCGTVSSGHGQVWVTSDTAEVGRATRIDARTNAIVFTVPIAAEAATFAAIGTGLVWTSSQDVTGARKAAVGIDAETGRTITTATLVSGGGPGALTATTYYAVDTDPGLVDAIDVHTGRIVRRYDAGAEPNALSISGDAMWVVDEATGRLLRFDVKAR